jgi:hypothetical protein
LADRSSLGVSFEASDPLWLMVRIAKFDAKVDIPIHVVVVAHSRLETSRT